MLQWFHDLITYGHDLQVRFKWAQPNDIGKYQFSVYIWECQLTAVSNLGQPQCLPHRDR